MGYKKFNQFLEGKYWRKYFENDNNFYGEIESQISKYINKDKSFGIDIGAGPGIGAKILDKLNFKTKLIGYEPSELYLDGEKISKELNSNIKYISIKGGIKEIQNLDKEEYDYILILRAAHEIVGSLKNKNKFFIEVERILKNLKKDGVLIIADPEYFENNVSQDMIKRIQEYQLEHIGHCHIPTDYVNSNELKKEMNKLGLKLIEEKLIEDEKVLEYLKLAGFELENCPYGYYIQSYKKKN